MSFLKRSNRLIRLLKPLILSFCLINLVSAQIVEEQFAITNVKKSEPVKPLVESVLPKYYNVQDGLGLTALIEKAVQSNGELVAVRIEIEKAKARLEQARLRPNPTLEVEQSSGRLVGNSGDGEISIGASLPIEIYGRRKSRIELAEIEIRAREAEVANFERRVANDVLTNYAEALAALREIEVLEIILELDLETTRFVQIRVNEGDTAPLELNLLQVEVERLHSKRQLAEGRLQVSLTKLKLLTNTEFGEPLQIKEQITNANLPQIPVTIDTAFEVALRTRPEIQIAQIEENLASAGLRLVRANSKPDLTAYTRYTQGRSVVDLPTGAFPQSDRSLTFGVAIGLPIFNKNQGAKAEAELAIRQAQAKKDFAEKIVRSEVISAFQKYEAASRALLTLETGVVRRSEENLTTFRRIYELGEIKITDLINEQRRLIDANRDFTEALSERYRAQSELLIAIGTSSFK